MKILIVEDDKLVCKLYQAAFTGSGFEVDTAVDGREAWNKLNASPPDLILLDLMLPDISGLEFLDRLKNNPSSQHLPVIANTNLVGDKVRQDAMSHGAHEYLVKDQYTPKEIVAEVLKIYNEVSQRIPAKTSTP